MLFALLRISQGGKIIGVVLDHVNVIRGIKNCNRFHPAVGIKRIWRKRLRSQIKRAVGLGVNNRGSQ
jgi:hypothetical protein